MLLRSDESVFPEMLDQRRGVPGKEAAKRGRDDTEESEEVEAEKNELYCRISKPYFMPRY